MNHPKARPLTVLGCLGRTLLGAVVGGFLSSLILFAFWMHWVETTYKPAIEATGDDGGSSEGWVLLLSLPPVAILGAFIGVGLIHLLYLWLTKRTIETATTDLFQDVSRIYHRLTIPLRWAFSWTRNQWKQALAKRRKKARSHPLN